MGCAVSRDWPASQSRAFRSPGAASLLLRLDVEQTAVRDYGANRHTWMEVRIARSNTTNGGFSVLVELQTEGKTPTRIPEFQRLTFRPAGATMVTLDKLGASVDAQDVVARGTVSLFLAPSL
eukprot:COSAG03_NODE_9201_length_738_cov_1.186228_2_plen_121_part_01